MIFNPISCYNVEPELLELLGKCADSLSISGDWTNTQYAGSPVDYTGLIFTVTYNDGTTASVTPTSISPSVWGSTVGTQSCTFTYEENGFSVSASKSAEVLSPLSIPLTLQARESGNISITKTGDPGTIYYSKNGGAQTELASNVNIPVSAGDKVSFYRTLSDNLSYYNYFKINCTNYCYIYGNVMSLYNKDSFINLTTIQYEYTFYNLFYKNSYIDINESVGKLVLPATTLANNCYSNMFNGCTSLTTTPELPATTLANNCYSNMFNGCTSLTSITCLATNISAEGCTDSWVYDVAATGTFKTPSSTAWTTGESGIPSGWTRVNA